MVYDATYNNPMQPNMGAGSQGPDPSPNESMESVLLPRSLDDVEMGSLQEALADNLGYYVEIDFLIGTNNIVTRSGILYAVGVNYVTLYQEEDDRYIVGDMYSIKFVTFYNSKMTPRGRNTANGRSGMGNMNGMFGGPRTMV